MKRLDELFQIKKGNDLELCYQHKNEDGINFVSRTENNNGVSARIEEIEGVAPWNSGTISVSLGGSVLEAFVQTEPYYTGYHMRVLIPRVPMDEMTKQYYCMCIRANKFKYGYGLQANKTIDALLVPDIDEIPNWVGEKKLPDVNEIPDYFLEDGYKKACWYLDNIDQEKFEKKYSGVAEKQKVEFMYNDETWCEFDVTGEMGLFTIKSGKRLTKSKQHEGDTLFIGATKFNNGLTGYIDAEPLYSEPCITVNYNGSVAEAFYQERPFWNSDDVKAWIPKFRFNKYIAFFLITIIRLQQQHYSYGIKWNQLQMERTKIKLPFCLDEDGKKKPDWDYMERFIKSLPFSEGI